MLVKPLLHSVFSLITYTFSKSSPTMDTLVEKLLNCCHCFLTLSGFPDLSGKVFLITFKFSSLDYLTMFCNVFITVKTVTLYKKLYFSLKFLKARKRSWH